MSDTAVYDDQSARERILHDLDTTFLVEAGAGSGKTTSLVGRMINLVKSGKAEIDEIAAITFTNKAASELSARFRLKLEQELKRAADETERNRLEQALRQINQCFIGTIHAFCGRLLRERPIEAGLDPNFTELEESDASEFRDRCWDEYLEKLRDEGQTAGIDELLAINVHVEELRAVFHRVSQYEDVVIFTQDVEEPDFDLIRLSLPKMVDEAARFIPTNPPEKGWDKLQEVIREARRFLRNMNLQDKMNVLAVAKMFDRSLDVTQNRWTEKTMGKQFKEQFQDWQQTVLQPFLQSWREYLHPKLIRFVQPAVEYSRMRRMESGILDFQDLLMKTAALLREHRDVREYFGRRYTRLLVDEFQDTDPIQAEMMLLLTSGDPDQADWRQALPRPGSLLIVGDPKQSIYRFRRADISTYNFVKQRIASCGDVLQLTKNFRSVAAIGDFVNYAFVSKFTPPTETTDHQANFVRMVTQQENPKGKRLTHGIYTLNVPKMERDRKADIAVYDAERIARYIAWACKGNLQIQEKGGTDGIPVTRDAEPGDFMILLKRKEFIGLYAEKLEQYGVPSDTSGSRAGYEELHALHMLVECLNDCTDRIPLLAVLRGMLFGVSDEALYYYAGETGRIAVYPLPEEEALSEKARSVYRALLRIQKYFEWVRSFPALTAFMRIIEDLGILPYAAVKETGAIRAGTLVKLLELIQTDVSVSASWHELTSFFRKLRQSDGLESTSLFAGSGGAVRIMNLHKAKGLEAPVVFLACPCGDNDHDAEEHVDRSTDTAVGFFTIKRPKDSYTQEMVAQPVGWVEKALKERTYILAEEDRLLYVAATRAKQLLVVSQYLWKPAIDPWSPLQNSLEKQLELDEVEFEPIHREPLNIAPDVAKELYSWNNWLASTAAPTYTRTSVTAQTKSLSQVELHRPAEGRGLAFGSVVHRSIEAIGNGMDDSKLETFIRMAAEEEGLEEKWLGDVLRSVRCILESEVWARSRKAKQAYHEFSIMVSKDNDLLKGVIDFLFEEEDGWIILDFKTDLFEHQYEQEFVDYYTPQVLAYVEEWERHGNKVKEAALYFISHNKYVICKRTQN
ncbi:UvrD-helicase domain-containing protein [Brevibacillus sp. H7]|uniref:UvrD-helicase domain-containing protein n=1 Tax=Brevibacillus sp. H7 TaxID=3349138 RepID=UPI0037F6E8E3